MDAMIDAARAVHFAAAMFLFGELLFASVVAAPRSFAATGVDRPGDGNALSIAPRLCAWALAASVVSGFGWFVVETALMSDLPLGQAFDAHNLLAVATGTAFGQLWVWRFGVAVVLGLLLAGIARSSDDRSKTRFAIAALVVAAVQLLTIAWAGHAASAQLGNYVQIVSDVVHLLAAGAWLGALPALVIELGRVQHPAAGIRVARRFSILGLASVAALVASGIGNAWYLVGDVPALIGTPYGRLLLVKLAVFAAMVAVAAINRASVSAAIGADETSQRRALNALRRNAVIEVVAGMVVVGIVGALGDMLPGAHQSPVWPFDRTLSWQVAQQTFGAGAEAVLAAVVAIVAAGIVIAAVLRTRWRLGIAGIATFVIASACFASILSVPAYPTTYAFSPTAYTTGAVVRGAALFAQNCAVCHGPRGRGDGPAAATPGIVPTDLAAHASGHRVGELYWWIAHGIPRSPMPAFASRLDESQLWDLVQFLRAQSDAASAAMVLGEHAQPWLSAIVAPDFTFERARREQESLSQPLGDPITLLVLYTLPRSLPYLRALDADAIAFRQLGLRVVAIPLTTDGANRSSAGDLPSSIAMTQPDVVQAYAMYARREGDVGDASASEVDYLIDRQGFIRARWTGVPDAPPDRAAAVFDQGELLFRERQRAPWPAGHVH